MYSLPFFTNFSEVVIVCAWREIIPVHTKLFLTIILGLKSPNRRLNESQYAVFTGVNMDANMLACLDPSCFIRADSKLICSDCSAQCLHLILLPGQVQNVLSETNFSMDPTGPAEFWALHVTLVQMSGSICGPQRAYIILRVSPACPVHC